jgi:2-methylisocitrate lyase-like PEP mutase family enzyme
MNTQQANQNFEIFHQLHHRSKPLILANVWNVKSAQIIETSGFDAMATSSGAIADSLGYKDGEQIPFAELLYVIKRIKTAVSIPLSVDMERGYTNDLTFLNEHIQQLIDAGVSGINIEDAQGVDLYLKKLNRITAYLKNTHQRIFINARTDVFLQKLPSPVETVIERAKIYHEAGADGLFVTGISDAGMIREIVSSTALPVNVVGTPAISVKTLEDCGVKRISMAVFLYRSTYNNMEKTVKEILNTRTFEAMF